jgi:sirohydrochlorin cobaltochelatase
MSHVVVLIGHGAPPSDAPRGLVQRLKSLEGQRHATGGPMSAEEAELDHKIRHFPRTDATDPYRAGIEAIAARLRPLVAVRVVVAYNEFCAPSIEEAVDALVVEGARELTLVTTMPTPGGVHAEKEIPEIIEGLRMKHSGATFRYAWPFDLDAVARLLADQVGAFAGAVG